MKTNFLVVGTQRGGTATLNGCLTQHPQVCVATDTELAFFDQDEAFARGTPNYNGYHKQFAIHSDHVAIGECASNYMYWQDCVPRIYRYNSEVKIIALIRNPIDRAYSHWQTEYANGNENSDFVDAINLEGYRLRTMGKRGQHKTFSYIDRGLYSYQIEHLLQYFDPHQLLFIKSEDFKDNTSVMLYRIFDFLNVPYIEVEEAAQNVGNYSKSMDPSVRNELIEIFRRDIYRVEELLGWNCNDWLKPHEVKVPKRELVS
ncbi:MAG: hypothetical protein ACJA01_003877 [Saprospiraceae bacterium]